MASKKISELTSATTPLGPSDLVEVVQGGVNKKAPKSAFGLQSVQAGTNVTIDDTDPSNPIINASGGGGSGTVESVTGDGVDNTDPDNPVLTFPEADEVVFTPAGNLSATDVQAALEELDSEKSNVLVTIRTLTASHTLDSTDLASIAAGEQLEIVMNVGSANNMEVPLDNSVDFPIGTLIAIRQMGAGQTTITATVGVTLNAPAGALRIAAQHAVCYLEKTATDTWNVNGELVV